jgi:DNA-binding transcriptional LysR family regulator
VELLLTETVLDLPMREADVAIRLSSPNQADLVRRPLMDIRMRLYASADYLERAGKVESLEDLAQHRFISFSALAPQPHDAADWLKALGAHAKNSHLKINSYFGVLKAALNGLGIAALPDYITREYPGLVNVLPEETSAPITVFFVYAEELRRSQRVLAFRDFILREVEIFTRGEGESTRAAE